VARDFPFKTKSCGLNKLGPRFKNSENVQKIFDFTKSLFILQENPLTLVEDDYAAQVMSKI